MVRANVLLEVHVVVKALVVVIHEMVLLGSGSFDPLISEERVQR